MADTSRINMGRRIMPRCEGEGCLRRCETSVRGLCRFCAVGIPPLVTRQSGKPMGRPKGAVGTCSYRARVLAVVESGCATAPEVAAATGKPASYASAVLSQLALLGKIERAGVVKIDARYTTVLWAMPGESASVRHAHSTGTHPPRDISAEEIDRRYHASIRWQRYRRAVAV